MTDMGIVGFVVARMEEREQRALAATVPGAWEIRHNPHGSSAEGEWEIFGTTTGGTIAEVVGDGWEGGGVWHQADAEFIAANSPAAVLADIAATRQLLDEIEAITVRLTDGSVDPNALERPAGRMLRAIASRDADHPGFDPSWKIAKRTT